MKQTSMQLGGIQLHYQLRFPDSLRRFQWHMQPADGTAENPIILSNELFEERHSNFTPGVPDSFVEYRILVEPTACALYEYGVFLFHSVAFAWRGYAWLLTAPSGTGKTTMFRNWEKQFPEETQMICGDMPVLRKGEDGRIMVFPSPWNGKERMGIENHDHFPLAGIIYLEQSSYNKIEPLNMQEMIVPLWDQFLGRPTTTRQIHVLAGFADYMFSRYPVWKYENRGDEESALLLHDTLYKHIQR